MTTDQDQQPEGEEDVTHEVILSVNSARPIPVRGEKDGPALFYTKMRNKLRSIGVNLDELDYRTEQTDRPPCFKLNGSDYAEWMSKASEADPLPLRYDLPGEPNYCNDCTPEFKARAVRAGACIFPNTRFEVRRDSGEKETIGVSRSADVPPERYIVYQQMTVPLSSLDERIQHYVRSKRVKQIEYAKMPKWMQEAFGELKGPKTEPAQ